MSAPVDTTKVARYAAIQSALGELVSAESSLNMYPDPVDTKMQRCRVCNLPVVVPATGVVLHDNSSGAYAGRQMDHDAETEPAYLSTVDANAKHALEHLHAAFRLMNMAHHDQESLKTQVYRLVVQLRELGAAPKVKTWLDEEDTCDSPTA